MRLILLFLSMTVAFHCTAFGQANQRNGLVLVPKVNLDRMDISPTDHDRMRQLLKVLLVNNEKIDLLNGLNSSGTAHSKPINDVTLSLNGATIVRLSQNQSTQKRILNESGIMFMANGLNFKLDSQEKASYAEAIASQSQDELNAEYDRVRTSSEQALLEILGTASKYSRQY